MAAQLAQLAIDLRRRRERQRRLIREKTIETINREIDRRLMPRRQTVDELLDRLGATPISVIDGLCTGHPSHNATPSLGWEAMARGSHVTTHAPLATPTASLAGR
jgi:hypothetical protein